MAPGKLSPEAAETSKRREGKKIVSLFIDNVFFRHRLPPLYAAACLNRMFRCESQTT